VGTTYHYANLTKREWFSADVLGGSSKWTGLGFNLGSRAFDLLLLDRHPQDNDPRVVSIGRWAGDSVAIVGDATDRWLQYRAEFDNLAADVVMLIYRCDGFDSIAEVAQHDTSVFIQLCHLAVTRQSPELEPHLGEKFGSSFRRKYKDFLSKSPTPAPFDLLRTRSAQ
jgi:hypothetical protein